MENEYSSLKVIDLKRELKSRGLRITGSKDELIERLVTYKSKLLGTSTDIENLNEHIIESDILDEEAVLGSELDDAEEDEVLKKVPDGRSNISDESNANNTTENFMSSPDTPQTTKKLSTPPLEIRKEETKRKVVLKRKSSVPLLGNIDKENEKKNEQIEHQNTNISDSTKSESQPKIIKIKSLPTERRLTARAERFGLKSAEDLKAARAARFGIQDSSSLGEPIDVLKKRAERFGAVVSPALSKKEFEEKMEARKARFGLTKPENNYEQKKKMREQRFKSSLY